MNYDELTIEETVILMIFKKLMYKRGLLDEFYFFNTKGAGVGGFCIYKENGKWISYNYEKGEISGYREYNSLYDLCMDIFEALDKESTDYCIKTFPSLVDFALNGSKEHKTR